MSALDEWALLHGKMQKSLDKAKAVYASISPQLKELEAEQAALSARASQLAEGVLSEGGVAAFQQADTAKLLYEWGWSNGQGAAKWNSGVAQMLTEADIYVVPFGGGWRGSNNNFSPVYAWSLSLPKFQELDEEKLERTARFIEGVYPPAAELMKLHDEDYSFNIFEHTLSEFGKLQLHHNKDQGSWTVTRTTYGRRRPGEPLSLRDALRLISREHWYE